MAETDWNPWRRFLALPNESRTKTVIVAFLVSVVCALLVSGATVLLRPIQTANRAAEEQARIADLVSSIPGMAALLEQSGGTLSTVIIDLQRGRAAQDVTSGTLDTGQTWPVWAKDRTTCRFSCLGMGKTSRSRCCRSQDMATVAGSTRSLPCRET